jgi:hypothetical protein
MDSRERNPFRGSQVPGTSLQVPFLGTEEPIVTCLRMKEKICLTTPEGSETRRNELSSGFLGA